MEAVWQLRAAASEIGVTTGENVGVPYNRKEILCKV
jgi:hypothetical protein